MSHHPHSSLSAVVRRGRRHSTQIPRGVGRRRNYFFGKSSIKSHADCGFPAHKFDGGVPGEVTVLSSWKQWPTTASNAC